MKSKLLVLFLVVAMTPATFALGGIIVGPYYGIAFPVGNDMAESGTMYGLQARMELLPMLSVGAHYSSRTLGNPKQVFFEGTPNEIEMEVDGGDITTFGIEGFLGKSGSLPGLNLYLTGGLSTYKWKRDYTEDFSKTAYSAGLGMEIVLPMKLGIEGRGLFEFASTGENGTYKSLLAFVGVNYHFGLGPM